MRQLLILAQPDLPVFCRIDVTMMNDVMSLGNLPFPASVLRYDFTLLSCTSQADIAATKPQTSTSDGAKLAWDAPKQDENICKQPQHEKVMLKLH